MSSENEDKVKARNIRAAEDLLAASTSFDPQSGDSDQQDSIDWKGEDLTPSQSDPFEGKVNVHEMDPPPQAADADRTVMEDVDFTAIDQKNSQDTLASVKSNLDATPVSGNPFDEYKDEGTKPVKISELPANPKNSRSRRAPQASKKKPPKASVKDDDSFGKDDVAPARTTEIDSPPVDPSPQPQWTPPASAGPWTPGSGKVRTPDQTASHTRSDPRNWSPIPVESNGWGDQSNGLNSIETDAKALERFIVSLTRVVSSLAIAMNNAQSRLDSIELSLDGNDVHDEFTGSR